MPFEIYIKKEIANEISQIVEEVNRDKIVVATLDITYGLLTKGNYKIPLNHILFIKEIT